MNKKELAAAVAAKCEMTNADATRALDATLEIITDELKKGEEIRLLGFGTFLTAHRKATEGRNPQSGETIKIKASTQAKFRAGKGLKEALN